MSGGFGSERTGASHQEQIRCQGLRGGPLEDRVLGVGLTYSSCFVEGWEVFPAGRESWQEDRRVAGADFLVAIFSRIGLKRPHQSF